MKTHTHPKDDGTTVTHGGHTAMDGHIHHADGPDGPAGPMMDQADGAGADECTDPLHEMLSRPPRDNLIRARINAGVEWRASDATPAGELYGVFSRFNDWYEVDSLWEGQFMETVLPGSFTETIKNDRANMRVLYDHGMDPSLGNKPLGPIKTLRETDDGPYYEVPLYDTDYNRNFLTPVLSGTLINGESAGSSGLGASFRFQVLEDQWNQAPKKSKRNPDGLPERSIVRAKVFEFGPVTFPANAGASAGVRSLSDDFLRRVAGDTHFLAEFTERVGPKVAARVLDSVPMVLRPAILPVPAQSLQEQLRRRGRALLVTSS